MTSKHKHGDNTTNHSEQTQVNKNDKQTQDWHDKKTQAWKANTIIAMKDKNKNTQSWQALQPST